MIVRLLVLIALAFSLGDLHDGSQIVDDISVLEAEPEPATETFDVEHLVESLDLRPSHTLGEILVILSRSTEAGRVFRPPRLLAA